MFYFVQCLIIGGVMLHNHYYEWTPNKVLAGFIGVGLAYLVTRIIWKLKLRGE